MIDAESGQQKGYPQPQGINQKQKNSLVYIFQGAGVSQDNPQNGTDTRGPAKGKGSPDEQRPGIPEFPVFNIEIGLLYKKLGA